jgi:tetratricopeptide (TPR) repeat protein
VKSIARLKDEARRDEQAGDWAKAISAYEQIIGSADGEPDAELPLYNRVGDLYVRIGRPDKAVPYYEDAANRYAEAGLYNNAMALCNKALRYVPEKAELFRRLGQLCAAQGFMTDARRWYREFADSMIRQDSPDEAFRALEEFAATSNDASDRATLGRLLHENGRTDDAVAQLARAHGQLLRAGEVELAESLRSEILTIAPDADPALAPVGAGPDRNARLAASSAELEELVELDERSGGGESAVEPGDTTIQPVVPGAGGGNTEPARVSGLETGFGSTDAVPSFGSGLLEGFESTALGGSDAASAGEPTVDSPADADGDRPRLDFDAGTAAAPDGGSGDHVPSIDLRLQSYVLGIDPAGEIERALGDEPADEANLYLHLPLLEDEGAAPSAGSLHLPSPDDPFGEVPHGSAFDLPLLGEDPPPGTEEEDDRGSGMDGFDLALNPVDPPAAEREEPDSSRPPARPGMAERRNAAPGKAAPAEPTEEAGGYVDLASLVNEPVPPTQTRFFVEEKEPTGDEDLDLAVLLAQLREKVTDSIDLEDAGSHYDLGLAFKEMGLLDEAITQFQIALRAGDGRLRIFEELGQCFFLKGQYGIAQKVLERALEQDAADAMELIGVYYYLGRAAEARGHVDGAKDAYERVLALDLAFQDVDERLNRL